MELCIDLILLEFRFTFTPPNIHYQCTVFLNNCNTTHEIRGSVLLQLNSSQLDTIESQISLRWGYWI